MAYLVQEFTLVKYIMNCILRKLALTITILASRTTCNTQHHNNAKNMLFYPGVTQLCGNMPTKLYSTTHRSYQNLYIYIYTGKNLVSKRTPPESPSRIRLKLGVRI